jgi:hypothetical protein
LPQCRQKLGWIEGRNLLIGAASVAASTALPVALVPTPSPAWLVTAEANLKINPW